MSVLGRKVTRVMAPYEVLAKRACMANYRALTAPNVVSGRRAYMVLEMP